MRHSWTQLTLHFVAQLLINFQIRKSKWKTCILQSSTAQVRFSDIPATTAHCVAHNKGSTHDTQTLVASLVSFLAFQELEIFFFHSKLIGILNKVSKCTTPPYPCYVWLNLNYEPCSNPGQKTHFAALEKTAVNPYFLGMSH